MRVSKIFANIFCVLWIGLAPSALVAQTINVGTLPQGSLAYSIASSVARIIADNSELKTRVVGFGGSNIFVPQLDQGKLDMTTATAIDSALAKEGRAIFEGTPHPNLRILTRLFTFQTGFIVPSDSEITSLAEFRGKKFPSGYSAQAIVDLLVRAGFATEGMTYDDVDGVPVPNFIRATEAMMAGRVAGSFLAPGSAIVRRAHAQVGVRFIDMKDTPENAKIMREIAPGTFFTQIKPTKSMPYITEPVTVIGFDFLILVGAHVPDEVAFEAAKALHNNKKALIAGHGVFNRFDPDRMAKSGLAVDYHPGAIEYYKSQGQWPPK